MQYLEEHAGKQPPEHVLTKACKYANEQLRESSVDDSLSGTTAVIALFTGKSAVVANVGDSRAVLARRLGSQLVSVDITQD